MTTAGAIPVVAAGAAAAFVAGLTGSGHCALMCGPLACAGLAGDARQRWRAAAAWQVARVAAYGAVGAALGGLGRGAVAALAAPAARALPWLMVAGLLFAGLEVGRRLPPLPGLSRIPRVLARFGERFTGPARTEIGVPGGARRGTVREPSRGSGLIVRAALRGAATPFLPCGLLYGAFIMALAGGGVAGGAMIMIAFALGALPALAFVQANVARLQRHPRAQIVLRRAVPLLAAAVLIWRTVAAGTGAEPPHCH